MKVKIAMLLCVLSLLISCSSSKSVATPEQIEALDQLVESRSYMIQSEWALPFVTNSMISIQNNGLIGPGNSANRISLLDIPNHLKMMGDSISSQLPYFGEVQMPTGYMNSDDNDIVFEGNLRAYKAIQNENRSYTISFDAKSKNENYDVTLILFPNLKSEMILQGNKRDPIRYTGRVTPITE